MYGLGIYLADLAQKSHRYIFQPKTSGGRQTYRMIICSVLGKSFEIEGYLKGDRVMHDVYDVRHLTEEDVDDMIETCQPCRAPKTVLELSLSVRTVKDGAELSLRSVLVGGFTLGASLRRRQKVPGGIGANKGKFRWMPSKQQQKRATCCISKV